MTGADSITLARTLLQRAGANGITISTAESCTGGLVAGAITEIPGSSAIFDRGFVTYTNAAKIDMLGVLDASLARYGAVSEKIAREMAEGALARSGATLAVSITGIAGPGGSDMKPEGRVCFCIARDGRASTSQTQEFGALGRAIVRRKSVDYALRLLLEHV